MTQFLDPFRRARHCGEPYGGHTNGCRRLRTVADGCRRLRTQTQNLANTASPPDPQVKREPSLRIREKKLLSADSSVPFGIRFKVIFFGMGYLLLSAGEFECAGVGCLPCPAGLRCQGGDADVDRCISH